MRRPWRGAVSVASRGGRFARVSVAGHESGAHFAGTETGDWEPTGERSERSDLHSLQDPNRDDSEDLSKEQPS